MKYFPLALLTILVACGGAKTKEIETVQEPDYTAHHSESITRVFEAHGSFSTWRKMNRLSYEMAGQRTLVELKSRYTRLESEAQTVGFDGEKVWVYPPNERADAQRMRYNLMFYFYAFPFVVGDPGITYEDLEPKEMKGKTYNVVKISYNEGIGDSPKDNYMILSDPQTHQMEWLMYTATFGGSETKDNYRLIRYGDWQNHNGLILPGSLQWYQYQDGVAGEPRDKTRTFENILISEEVPAMENFTMPEGAQVAGFSGQ